MQEEIVLDGWCKVGSPVVSDFYANEANVIRRVTKIHVWPGVRPMQAKVWTTGGTPLEVDFHTWIKPPQR